MPALLDPGLKTSLADLLAQNRAAAGERRYTRPAPSTYEHQWLWDSCFHAIAWRWIDPRMAGDELLAVAARQVESGPDAGMIPHMTYWNGGGEELWGSPHRSSITQPPLVAFAAWKVHAQLRDPALLAALYPRIAAFHDWLDARRDPDGDALACVIHPWEAGCDSSPRWDRAMGLPDHFPPAEGSAARRALALRLPEYGHDPSDLARAGLFVVETVEFNAIRAADLEALSAIAAALDRPAVAAVWRERARAVQRAVQTRLLEPSPRDLEGPDEIPILEENAAQFAALFGGCAAPRQAKRLVERLRQPDYWTEYPVPTTPTSARQYVPDQYWRGNTWIPINYLIYLGLRRYGYARLASQLAARTVALVREAGCWEYYHPVEGRGLGARDQSWTALLLDIDAVESGAAP